MLSLDRSPYGFENMGSSWKLRKQSFNFISQQKVAHRTTKKFSKIASKLANFFVKLQANSEMY